MTAAILRQQDMQRSQQNQNAHSNIEVLRRFAGSHKSVQRAAGDRPGSLYGVRPHQFTGDIRATGYPTLTDILAFSEHAVHPPRDRVVSRLSIEPCF